MRRVLVAICVFAAIGVVFYMRDTGHVEVSEGPEGGEGSNVHGLECLQCPGVDVPLATVIENRIVWNWKTLATPLDLDNVRWRDMHDVDVPDHDWNRTVDPKRAALQSTEVLLEYAKLEKGMSALDLGAGAGFYSFLFSELVGEEGTVYSSDINIQMVEKMRLGIKKFEKKNIQPVLVKFYQAGVPENSVDFIFINNVYHLTNCCEILNPKMMEQYAASLRDNGRMLISHEFVFKKSAKKALFGASEGTRAFDELTAAELIELAKPWFTVEENKVLNTKRPPEWGEVGDSIGAGYILVLKKK